MNLASIIKDSEYNLSLFSEEYIKDLENNIIDKSGKAYILCQIRKKEIKLTPEEVVRQLYLMVLMQELDYPDYRIQLEYEVSFGREKKRADIVVFDKDNHNAPYIIVELKKPKLRDGKEQLKGYCNATGAPIGIWTNGQQISYYHRKDPNYFEDLSAIPNVNQKLSDILDERWKIEDLKKRDKLVQERKSLKDLILEMEDEVLANAGIDVFEEVFKLIFTKLYDEMERSALAELEEYSKNIEESLQRERDNTKRREESLQNERYYAQNSIKITKVAVSEPNSAGGVDAYINFYNNSNKTIKYVNFSVKAYNAVDDVVTCTIRDKYISNLKYTGPVNPYSYSNDNSYWDCVWYNYQIKYCKIVGVKIDYMDGTNVEISEENMSYLY